MDLESNLFLSEDLMGSLALKLHQNLVTVNQENKQREEHQSWRGKAKHMQPFGQAFPGRQLHGLMSSEWSRALTLITSWPQANMSCPKLQVMRGRRLARPQAPMGLLDQIIQTTTPVFLPLQPQTLTSALPLVGLISPLLKGAGVWVYGAVYGGLFSLIITEKPYCGRPRAVSGPNQDLSDSKSSETSYRSVLLEETVESYFSLPQPESECEEQTKYFFVTVGLWVYPSPLSVAKLHPSLELPQTHLQKIRHEIVWLLHHRGHPPPPPQPTASSRAFPPAVLWGSVSLRQLHPVGCLSPACENEHLGTAVHDSGTGEISGVPTSPAQVSLLWGLRPPPTRFPPSTTERHVWFCNRIETLWPTKTMEKP
ncbi:hypothetical protein NQZ68_032999 [Dissostichus eleginoides]|nr:hypothetical protein NQZ68_032999 [Dissostichus eleginoides]